VTDRELKNIGVDLLKTGLNFELSNKSHPYSGCIVMLHRIVKKESASKISMNRDLEVTEEDLIGFILIARSLGYEFISLDEILNRYEHNVKGKFIALTFDDGYRDNLELALPILSQLGVPFTVYVTTDILDGKFVFWWYLLESLILYQDVIEFKFNGLTYSFNNKYSKEYKFEKIRTLIIECTGDERDQLFYELFEKNNINLKSLNSDLSLNNAMLMSLAANSLVTIGSHTVSHPSLAELDDRELDNELIKSKEILEKIISRKVEHFCYPYGSAENCNTREFFAASKIYKSATTTIIEKLIKSNEFSNYNLPRLPLRGNYAGSKSHIKLLLDGLSPIELFKVDGLLTDIEKNLVGLNECIATQAKMIDERDAYIIKLEQKING
jgi:peptidoglycan/xylan/chitin deacetylase (PgdA/CDA1 family)